MKNINEESEKLSHEEKPSSQNHNEQNVLINSNQNQNNKIESSNNIPQEQNRKYHINMNHQHQHHHQQDFSNPKFLYYYIIRHIKFYSFLIQNYFNSLTSSLDMSLQNSSLNNILKGYIHSKQIIFIIYIFNIQYLISIVDKISFLNFLNQNAKSFMILSIILLYVHYNFFKNRLFLEKDEELEKFILKRNPQLKRGKCERCDMLRVMRSCHCLFCDKCVKKYHFHSNWFNICIGANNELIYSISLFFTCLYFYISNLILWYYILFRSDLLNYLTFVYTLFAIVGIYVNYISGQFLYKYIFNCLFTNLTFYEKSNIRRFIYLTNGQFNPFNKGVQRNLEEMLINMFDIDIYSEYKNYNCQNLSEIIDENDNNGNNEEEYDMFNDISSSKLMLKSVEHFDPLITSKGNIYKFVDGKEIINWNRCLLFTVFDIINSPVKDSMIKQAKYYLEQNEALIKERNNNINNEKIDENHKEDEKIDQKENSEDNKSNKSDKENEEKNLINANSEDNNN